MRYCFFCFILYVLLTFSLASAYSEVVSEQRKGEEKKYNLVVCAVFQNEDFYLKEWLEFHKIIGVQHFYLYNNLSTDSYREILRPYIESGEVDLFDWPVETKSEKEYLNNLQLPVYNHALSIAKQTTDWIAFIDLDEFLFPVENQNLNELLKEYEAYGGLAVNWQMYGTSWLDVLPENGLIIENLIYRAVDEYEKNKIIKMIVQPQFVQSINNPHFFNYIDGYFAVNSSKQPLPGGIGSQSLTVDRVRINHYWSGTYHWLVTQKLPRREKWGLIFRQDFLEFLIMTLNQVKDESLIKFVPQLKKNIFDLDKRDKT